jgi:hypothetical protein
LKRSHPTFACRAGQIGYVLGTIQSALTGTEVTDAGQRFGGYRLNPMAS